MTIKNILLKLNENNNTVIESIYSIVDISNFPDQCHYIVSEIEQALGYIKEVEYIFWDEYKWEEVAEILKQDDRKFNVREIDNLIQDIADFSMNGHSFIRVGDNFADPYLYQLGVKQSDIEGFNSYLYAVYREVGIIR